MTQEMREPTFFVLAALAGGRQHGYGLLQETERMSEGRVSLKVGTLYAVLERLTREGLVRVAGEEAVEGRLRRYFELTDAGTEALAAETDRLFARARAAEARLALRTASFGPA